MQLKLSKNLIGITLMVGATVVMIIQHSMVKMLAAELPMLEIVFFRTLTALLFFIPWMMRSSLTILRTDH